MIGQSEISKNLQRWDSSVYDRCSRASALEDAITACSLPTRVESADFGATLRYRVADDYSFADAEYENFHGSRGKDETVADGRNFTLTLVNQGQVRIQAGCRKWLLGEGDFILANSLVEGQMDTVGSANVHSLVLPERSLVPDYIWRRHDNLVACQQPDGVSLVLSNHIRTLFRQLPFLGVAELTALIQPTTGLIACAANFLESTPQLSKAQATCAAIKQYISVNLKDPELTPALIAYKHCISTRYLHMLFKREGVSISDWIKIARIEGCKSDIARLSHRELSVTDIALDWGFNDLSTFYRLFKQATGLAPGQYKKSLLS